MKKFKTSNLVSRAKRGLKNGMGKVLNVIPMKYLVGGTMLVVFVIVCMTSCKTETDCPDYNPDIQKNPPKFAKSDNCETERALVYKLESDSITQQGQYCDEYGNGGSGWRGAIWPAIHVPGDWSVQFWNPSQNYTDPVNTPFDSTLLICYIIDWWNAIPQHPIHQNAENMSILHSKCVEFISTCTQLPDARKALTDCESVGITEYKPVWHPDKCGGWWEYVPVNGKSAPAGDGTNTTGNAANMWESTNTWQR